MNYWIIITKRGTINIVFNFETAKEYADKGFKVIYVKGGLEYEIC